MKKRVLALMLVLGMTLSLVEAVMTKSLTTQKQRQLTKIARRK